MSYIKQGPRFGIEGNVVSLETRAAAGSVNLTGANLVIVDRWDINSPYAPANYAPVSSEPAHEGKFQDRTGQWFDLQPDNGRILTAWLGTGMASAMRAFAISKKIDLTPGETYTYTGLSTQFACTGEDVSIRGPFSTLHRASSTGALFNIVGGWEAEQTFTATALRATVLPVQDGTAYAIGQDIKPISDDAISPYSDAALAGEFAVITNIVGNNITLGGPLLHAYTTNPRVARIKTVKVEIDIGRFTVQTGTSGRLIFIEACVGANVHVGESPYMTGATLDFQGCLGSSVVVDYDHGGTSGGGYGVRTACSEKCRLQVKYAAPIRHVIDMGADGNGVSDFSNHGLSSYNVGHDSFGSGSFEATFATHHGTYRNTFIDCGSQFSAGSGTSIRGTQNGAMNFRSYQDVQGVSAFNQIGSVLQTTTGTWFDNARIIDPVNFFAATAAGSIALKGGYLERTSNDAQNALFSASLGDISLSDMTVRVTTGSLTERIVLTTGAYRVALENCVFDLRGVNLSSDMTLVESLTGAVTVVIGGVTVIADEGLQLIRFGGSLGAGSSFGGIQLPTASVICVASDISAYMRTPVTIGNASLLVSSSTVPGSSATTGEPGTVTYDTGFIYICVAPNTWRRVAISAF